MSSPPGDLPSWEPATEGDARPRRDDRARLVRRGVGVLLVLLGLGCVGFFGWQLLVTDLLAERRHSAGIAELEREWAELRDDAPRAPRDEPAQPVEPEPEPGDFFAVVRIPRFGDEYAVPLVAGIDDDSLASGFGHFPEAALPGEEGNFALAGHRITHGAPLAGMTDLEVGDVVEVETARATYTYRIDTDPEALRVPFTAGWVLASAPRNPDEGGVSAPDQPRLLTLTTCAELFHTDDRLVAFGHLVDVEPAF